jgi:hypothetical protein
MPRLTSRLLAFVLALTCSAATSSRAGDVGLPPPVVPHGFGVNIHFTDPGPGEVDRFAEAGYRFVRMDFGWGGIERRPGVYDFSAYDRLVAQLAKVNARPILILDYGNRLYDGGQAPHTDAGRAAFAKFASAGAVHFRGKGVLWEIWNEPNIDFWKPKPSAVDYARLSLATARAVRAADPDAVILAPGTSEFPWPFFETVFRSGLLEHLDAVSVHPYRSQNPETAADDYGRLRALIARYAPAAKANLPIISSEWGYSTNTRGLSEARQAQYLTRQWLANLASGVNLSIFYDWKDDGPDPRENEHRFGTVHQDLTPKPSFLAAKALIAALDGFSFRHRLLGKDENDWRLLFQKGDTDVLALVTWSASLGESDSDATPKVRKVDPGDADFAGLRALAGVHFAAGPLAESAARPASLVVTALGSDITVAVGDSSATRPVIAAGTTGRVVIPPAALRPAHRTESIGFLRDGKPLPAIAPLSIWRIDPLALSAAPHGGELVVAVHNPARSGFLGQLGVVADQGSIARAPVRSRADELSRVDVRVPLPEGAHRVILETSSGVTVAQLDTRRYEPMAEFPRGGEGLSRFELVHFVDNAPKPGQPVRKAEIGPGSGRVDWVALEFDCAFGPGWQYLAIVPPSPASIPSRAKALTLWIDPISGAPDDALRCRFSDTTGQTFQPDLGPLGESGWRAVTIPLEGKFPGGHWGGADDGVPHPPLRWEALVLIDSAHRQAHKGHVRLASPFYVFGH